MHDLCHWSGELTHSQPLLVLPMLQVLILDKTTISDEGLRAVASSALNLKYLSLQVRRRSLVVANPHR